ncbi:MAG: hypothetical protein EXS03_03000 [Phycisphaerales bacterium]|nr:hypothetical protein [Phycisphaerales bacterium]
MPTQRATLAALSLGLSLALGACQTTPRPLVVELPPGSEGGVSAISAPVVRHEVTFAFRSLGKVSHDGFTLPLLSPDGSMAAVQASSSADWSVVLGESSSIGASRIEVVPLTQPRLEPRVEIEGDALLLGRSADEAGFLVESPRADGSRWIGRGLWTGGTPEWLVRDAQINCFACLSEQGALAWCRRRPDDSGFSIAVATPGAAPRAPSWEVPAPDGGTWMAPTFSHDGRTLFALRLRDGVLALCAFGLGDGLDPTPRVTREIFWRADLRTAYQSLVPLHGSPREDGRLQFYNPRFGRISLWDPWQDSIAMASPGTAAAITLTDGRLLTATAKRLALEATPQPSTATEEAAATAVIEVGWIPLGTSARGSPIVVRVSRDSLEFAELSISAGSP